MKVNKNSSMEKSISRNIKSKSRVENFGEVFTPDWMVKKMLEQPEIKAKTESLTATFLESAAGEGAFLVEILKRKLYVADQESTDAKEFGEKCLIALTSLYGIELLEDNIVMLVMNMVSEFNNVYIETINRKYNEKADEHVLDSAKIIIRANMVQGDALKRQRRNGDPIIITEWELLPIKRGIRKIQRTEYTFDAIIEGNGPTGTVQQRYAEQLDLDLFSEEENKSLKLPSGDVEVECHYVLVKLTDIYKQLIEID